MAFLNGADGFFGHLMGMTPHPLGRTPSEAHWPDAASLAETLAFGPNPGDLRMLSYVPEGLPAGAPLVVVLHGCGQTAAEYDVGAGWSTLADRFGFALLLPEQRRANNGRLCFDWFQTEDVTRDRGEVASIAGMVTAMIERHDLDPRRVYVTGLSAGGAMTAALLATYPDLFAGGAIIAGLPYGSAGTVPEAFGVMGQGRIRSPRELGDRVRDASAHRGDWPTVSIWQGLADTTVNPVNAEELRKQWADVHGLVEAPPEESIVDGATRRAWHAADGRVVLETYVIPGLGHATPIDPEAADDAAQCGRAGVSRFILPAGISSSYRIAEGWGLVGRRAASPPRQRAAHAPGWQDLLPDARQSLHEVAEHFADPAALIEKALRSAGLLDGRRKN